MGNEEHSDQEPGDVAPLSRRTSFTVCVLSVVAAVIVAVVVTPTGFVRPSLALIDQQTQYTEPHLAISGYVFNDDVKQVEISGTSNLPEGAVVVVEIAAFAVGAAGDGPHEQITAPIDAEGAFAGKAPYSRFGDSSVLKARVAFDPSWKPNAAFRAAYGSNGEKLWGSRVISDGDTKQLYDDQLLFRDPIF